MELREESGAATSLIIIGILFVSSELMLGAVGATPIQCLGALIFFSFIAMLAYAALFAQTWKFDKPRIILSATPVQMGQVVGLSYSQKFKHPTDIEYISFKLIWRETTSYLQGTSSKTRKHEIVVDEFGLGAEHYRAGDVIEEEWQIQIPENSIPISHPQNYRFQYFVKVHVGVKDWVDYKRDFEIRVTRY